MDIPATSDNIPGTLVLRDNVSGVSLGKLTSGGGVDPSIPHPSRAGIITEDQGDGIGGRIGIRTSSDPGESPYVIFYRSRGTLASPTAVQSGDALGTVFSSSYDGSSWSGGGGGASMSFRASESWNSTNRGTLIAFLTTPNGQVTASERFQIKSTGQVRFIPLAADPAGAEAGDVYYNSGSNKLKVYNGTSWVDLH